MSLRGIDVSHWQGEVIWPQVAKTNTFAFAKASEGVGYEDPRFQQNYQGIRDAGMFRGAYHFARVSKKRGHTYSGFIRDAEDEADWFLDTVGNDREGTMPAVLDIEWDKRARDVGHVDLVDWCLAWLSRVEMATGVVPIVYTGQNFWRYKLASTNALFGYHLWLAQYKADKSGDGPKLHQGLRYSGWPWRFWQYTHKLRVEGVHGPCDGNIFPGSRKMLEAFIKGPSMPDRPNVENSSHAHLTWWDRLICWSVESVSDQVV